MCVSHILVFIFFIHVDVVKHFVVQYLYLFVGVVVVVVTTDTKIISERIITETKSLMS